MQAGYLQEQRHRFAVMQAAYRSEESFDRTFFGAPASNDRISDREYDRLKRENREWIESR